MKSRILYSAILVLASLNSFATHNRGGEILFRALDTANAMPLQYEISLITYTKGSSPADRCTLVIYFGDGDSAEVARVNGSLIASDEWGHSCSGQAMGEKVGSDIKKNIYKAVHTYPGSGSYKIHAFDPNRNGGIINIPNSVNIPFYLESEMIISSFTGKNKSPEFFSLPANEGCVGFCYKYLPDAYDADGDSLSFELANCLGDGGQTIPGYTMPNINGGGVLSMNPQTGELIWCVPQLQGEYNIAFYVKEWRKGKLIGRVERDMQLVILPNQGMCNTIGINENEKNVKVDYIPLNNEIRILTPIKLKYQLFNLNGKVVQSGDLSMGVSLVSLLSVSSGMYLMKVSDNESFIKTQKIVFIR